MFARITSPFNQLSPLFLPLIALIASICIRFYTANILFLAGNIGLILLCTALIFGYKNNRSYYLIGLTTLMMVAGWARTNMLLNYYTQFPFQQTNSPCSLQGTILNKSYNPTSRIKHTTLVDIETINGNPIPHYIIQLYTLNHPPVTVGDTVILENISIKAPKNRDFQWYLIKEGIASSVFSYDAQFKIKEHPSFCATRNLFQLRHNIFMTFKKQLPKEAFALFSSLFLGEKASSKYTLEKIQQKCKKWGIMHYLARSGLHLVMVFSAYEMMLRFLPLPYILKQLILLMLGIMYYLLSWPSISFIRAFLVFIFYKIAIFIFRPIHFVHILLLTCLVILLTNPFQLFFLDFQLSFLLTFALGWLNMFKSYSKTTRHA